MFGVNKPLLISIDFINFMYYYIYNLFNYI